MNAKRFFIGFLILEAFAALLIIDYKTGQRLGDWFDLMMLQICYWSGCGLCLHWLGEN